MRFETNPQLILDQEELLALDSALKLCRDMDTATSIDDYDDRPCGCEICPKKVKCSRMAHECVFTIAHTALKEIIDIAIVK